MAVPVLVTYNLQGQRQGRIRLMAARFGIRFYVIMPQHQHIPIGQLLDAQLPEHRPMEEEPFTQEMMVMARFPSHLASRFLDAFRQQRVPSVRLKAMLTETNSQWSGLRLYQELSQEADYFARMGSSLHAQQAQKQQDQPAESGDGEA